MITIDIPGDPFGKQRPKVTMRGDKCHAYTPEKTVDYENFVKYCFVQQMKECRASIFDCAISMEIQAFYGIPESFSGKKKKQAERGEIFPTVKPDADNIAKIICDALNKIAFWDDKQITHLLVKKRYTPDAPHVLISIEEMPKGS